MTILGLTSVPEKLTFPVPCLHQNSPFSVAWSVWVLNGGSPLDPSQLAVRPIAHVTTCLFVFTVYLLDDSGPVLQIIFTTCAFQSLTLIILMVKGILSQTISLHHNGEINELIEWWKMKDEWPLGGHLLKG